MKYKWMAIFLGGLLLLGGCGETPAPSSGEASEAAQAFGVSVAEAPTEMAQTTQPAPSLEEGAEGEAAIPAQTEETAETGGDLTDVGVTAVVCAVHVDGLTYDSGASGFYWRAMGYFILQGGEEIPAVTAEGDTYRLSSQDLAPYAQMLFGSYDGTYPSVTEEDPLVVCEMGLEADTFFVAKRALALPEVTVGEAETQEDGTYRIRAEVIQNGAVEGSYILTLRDETTGDGVIKCITGITAA